MLKKLLVMCLTLGVLTGCGQVMVFGRVIGEPRAQTGTRPAEQSASKAVGQPGAAAESADVVATKSDAAVSSNAPATSPAADPAPPSPPLPSSPIVHRVKSVALTLNPQAASSAAADPRFNTAALLEAIETELRSRKLLDTQDPTASDKAEILLSDFTTRSATNAVVFGYHLGSGSLTADIHVGDSSAAGPDNFKVIAETRLAIAASGADPNPLGPLYRRFAVLTADRLAGTPSKPEEPDRDLMPR